MGTYGLVLLYQDIPKRADNEIFNENYHIVLAHHAICYLFERTA